MLTSNQVGKSGNFFFWLVVFVGVTFSIQKPADRTFSIRITRSSSLGVCVYNNTSFSAAAPGAANLHS